MCGICQCAARTNLPVPAKTDVSDATWLARLGRARAGAGLEGAGRRRSRQLRDLTGRALRSPGNGPRRAGVSGWRGYARRRRRHQAVGKVSLGDDLPEALSPARTMLESLIARQAAAPLAHRGRLGETRVRSKIAGVDRGIDRCGSPSITRSWHTAGSRGDADPRRSATAADRMDIRPTGDRGVPPVIAPCHGSTPTIR